MPDTKKSKLQGSSRWMGFGIEIALNMVLPILGGHWIDGHFNIRPYGIMVGALVGFVAFFWNIYKIAREN